MGRVYKASESAVSFLRYFSQRALAESILDQAGKAQVELIAASKDDPVCQAVMTEIRKGSTNPEFWTWENPQAVDAFTKLFNEVQRHSQKQQQDLNEVAKQDALRLTISRMVRVMANQILSRCKKPRDAYQTVVKLLFTSAAKVSGSFVEKADSTQLEASRKYLANLNNEINNGNIPQWLR